MDDGRIPVRSFRVVFALERRLHKIDRWRIPVPHGIPLRGIAYALTALVLVLLASGLPVIGGPMALMAPPLRLVILPIALAYLLIQVQTDGRPAHALAVAAIRQTVVPRRIASWRAVTPIDHRASLGELVVVADERFGRYRRAVIAGPARVVLRLPARARTRARGLRVRQAPGGPMLRGRVVELGPGQRLEVER